MEPGRQRHVDELDIRPTSIGCSNSSSSKGSSSGAERIRSQRSPGEQNGDQGKCPIGMHHAVFHTQQAFENTAANNPKDDPTCLRLVMDVLRGFGRSVEARKIVCGVKDRPTSREYISKRLARERAGLVRNATAPEKNGSRRATSTHREDFKSNIHIDVRCPSA
jgi:hypothetical protein